MKTVKTPFFLTLLAGATLVAGIHAQGAVHVVDDDGGPGVAFTEIRDAAAAADDGDTLLVRSGSYARVELTGRALTIVADAGADVTVAGLVVFSTPADGAVVLSGLHSVGLPGLSLLHNVGTVFAQDCTFVGADQAVGAWTSGISCGSSQRVTLVDCHAWPAGDGTHRGGLVMSDSHVDVHGGSFTGAPATPSTAFGPIYPAAAPGVHVSGDSTLFAAGATFTGGEGNGMAWGCVSTAGGPGLVLAGAPLGAGDGPRVSLLDCALVGGAAGTGGVGGCPSGEPGPPLQVLDGEVVDLPGAATDLVGASPWREGESAALTWSGTPGEIVVLGLSLGTAPVAAWPLGGVLHPAPDAEWFVVGVLDASGQLQQVFDLPASLTTQGLTLTAQAAHFGPGGTARLGPPRHLLVLDESL